MMVKKMFYVFAQCQRAASRRWRVGPAAIACTVRLYSLPPAPLGIVLAHFGTEAFLGTFVSAPRVRFLGEGGQGAPAGNSCTVLLSSLDYWVPLGIAPAHSSTEAFLGTFVSAPRVRFLGEGAFGARERDSSASPKPVLW